MEIRGKVALVTGGAVRIGKAISLALVQKGAKVALHYNTSEIEARNLGADIFQADLSKISEVEKLVDAVEEKLGPIQILINNASIFEKIPFLEITEADWDRHLDINLKAPFLLSQAVAKSMLQKNAGKIINIADFAAIKPYRHHLPYCVSKAGLVGLTKVLAKELAPHIQVNAVAPGPTIAPEDYTEEEKQKIAKATLTGKWGDPKEIANAVLFLIEGTDNTTGSVFYMEGGRLLV